MRHSADLDKLSSALLGAQQRFPEVVKDAIGKIPLKTGGSYEYGYATLTDLQRAILPILHKNGLTVLQGTDTEDQQPSSLVVLTRLLHISGQWIESGIRVPLDKISGQGAGTADTYGSRYGLKALLSVITNDLDDDAATETPAPQRQSVTTTTARPATTNTPARPPAATPIAAVAGKAADWMTLVLPDGCPKCGGPLWDNRDPSSKKNPKAPDFKCRDKECKDEKGYTTGGWCEKGAPAVKQAGGGPGLETVPTALQDDEMDALPFSGAR